MNKTYMLAVKNDQVIKTRWGKNTKEVNDDDDDDCVIFHELCSFIFYNLFTLFELSMFFNYLVDDFFLNKMLCFVMNKSIK